MNNNIPNISLKVHKEDVECGIIYKWKFKRFINKKMQTYKPDSVPDKSGPYHLSRFSIAAELNLPTLRQRTRSP